jgi:hypothetical protein
MDPDPVTSAALFQAVTASPHLVRVLPIGVPTATVAGSTRGHVVAAGTTDGRLLRWDLATNALTQVWVGNGRGIRGVAIDADGGRIVASNDTDVFIWNGANGTRPVVLPIPQREGEIPPSQRKMIAISPSGDTVAAVRIDSAPNSTLVVLDGASGRELRRATTDGSWDIIGLPDDDTLNVQLGAGQWRQYSTRSLTETDSGGQMTTPSDAYYCCGFTADAGYFAWAKFDSVSMDAMNPHPSGDFLATGDFPELSVSAPIDYPDRFAVATDGREVAVAGGGQLCVGRPGVNSKAEQLTGTGHVDAFVTVGELYFGGYSAGWGDRRTLGNMSPDVLSKIERGARAERGLRQFYVAAGLLGVRLSDILRFSESWVLERKAPWPYHDSRPDQPSAHAVPLGYAARYHQYRPAAHQDRQNRSNLLRVEPCR